MSNYQSLTLRELRDMAQEGQALRTGDLADLPVVIQHEYYNVRCNERECFDD